MGVKTPKSEKVISLLLSAGLVVVSALIVCEVFRSKSLATSTRPAQPASISYKLPAEWKLEGSWETYPNGKLYEKIDGQETIFYEYGVNRLDCASASINNLSFDIYVYQMNDPDGALGVYLAQAPSDYEELNIGTMSDISGGQVRVFQGATYLEIAPQEKNTDGKFTKELAKSILSGIKRKNMTGGSIIEMLPTTGREKGTLAFNKENAFGLKSLAGTFSATYTDGKGQFDYLVRKISSAEGKTILGKVRDEVKEFGGKTHDVPPESFAGEFMGKTLLLTHKNNFLCGIYGDISIEQAQSKLDLLMLKTKEQPDGRK
ncbi:MAG: DUF6599 family protein [Phycisphaerae bacterium]